jgi:hypothetical protein
MAAAWRYRRPVECHEHTARGAVVNPDGATPALLVGILTIASAPVESSQPLGHL